ncbi:Predicted membrane protein (DUF2061) [Seminavis robusta]|uniref:Predicted membrane protein (DUF2061) n=1 Tax=Seminavis robusta TaxID=568900 RepID=A0A9N8HEI2_9STRA|nr:Predicted membrane protein (DUF2061) [Seminavis robusta]|eukprot:Sro516_g158520.1 Predicted membrane protein (DUF2061) (105) ;mRNA; r:33539-33853
MNHRSPSKNNNNNNNNNNNQHGTMEEGGSNYQTMAEIPSTPTESHTRSILKGITWRFVATMTTVVIAWVVIGDAGVAFQIGFFEAILKIAIYYVHERIWAKIPV